MLRAIVDNAPVAIIAVDLRGVVTAWSSAAERLFGWSAAETVGRDNPIIRGEDRPAFERLLADAARGEIDRPAEGLRRRKDGSEVHVSGARAVMRGAAGDVIGVVGMFHDQSDQDRAMAALAESEERYRSVVTGLEEGITLHDAEGRILTANPSASAILGASAAALVGRRLDEPGFRAVDEEMLPFPADRHPIAVTLATGKPCSGVVLRMVTPGGEHRWIKISARAIPPPTAHAATSDARAVSVLSDITAARCEEDLRRRSEQNFRTLIERSPDGVAVYQGSAVLYVNPTLLAMLGYDSPGELIGHSPLALVHPDDRATVSERIRAYAMKGKETAPTEERFLRRDGAPVPVEVTSIPIFFDDAPSTLVHARDLTDRKRLEAQLVMADRLASVGRLAATVGHEINNPLAYVLANLEMSLERLGDGDPEAAIDADRAAEITEMLREAREGAERVRHIVRDLKVFSRGESTDRVAVDPRRVLDSCANMAMGEIRHRARLVKRYEETPRVLANEARLGQVLLNLLINAAHAIPEEALTEHHITVSTSVDALGRVVIAVSDTGSGIPDEVKKQIFEPFFTTKSGGSGLGLSICQSIVTALGGEITVESAVGEGTTFRIFLPPARDSEPPASKV